MSSHIMKYFNHAHLPKGEMRQTSKIFSLMAQELDQSLPECAEKAAGLRKLLEAKDCMVRAALEADS